VEIVRFVLYYQKTTNIVTNSMVEINPQSIGQLKFKLKVINFFLITITFVTKSFLSPNHCKFDDKKLLVTIGLTIEYNFSQHM